MTTKMKAVFRNGSLKLLEPVNFTEEELVTVTVSGEEDINELIDHACMRRAALNADESVSIEWVRAYLTSQAPGKLSELVGQEREER